MTVDWKQQLKKVVEKFSADEGIIHRFDPKNNCLLLIAYTDGFSESLIESVKQIPIGKGTIVPAERMLNVRGIICVPIFHDEEVVGCLGIGCYEERLFTQQETDALINEGKKIAPLLVSKR